MAGHAKGRPSFFLKFRAMKAIVLGLLLILFGTNTLYPQGGPPPIAISKAQLDTAEAAEVKVQLNLRLFAAYHYAGDIDSANYFLAQAETIATATDQLDFLGRINLLRANDAEKANELASADSLTLAAIQFLEASDDLVGTTLAYAEYSDLLDQRNQPQKALNMLVKAQRLADSSQIGGLIYDIGLNRAIKLRRMGLYDEALTVLQYIRPFHDPKNPRTQHQPLKWAATAAGLYADLPTSAKKDSLVREGLLLLNEQIAVADSLEWATFQSDLRIAKTSLLSINDPVDLEIPTLIQTILSIGKARKDTFSLHQATMILQNFLLTKGQSQQAYSYNEEVLAYANSLNDLTYSRTTYKRCYETAKANGKSTEALDYYEQYTLLQDSLTSIQKTKQYQELQEQYEAEKKERTILQLRQDKNALALQTAKLRNRILGAVGLLILLGLFAAVLYYRKQRSLALSREKIATTEQQLLRAQMNPHFIFNTLNSIKRLYVEGKMEQANDFLADFSQLLRQILERSYEVSIPIEEEVAFLRLYLALEQRRLGGEMDFSIDFDPEAFEFDDVLPAMLLQPLAENAIWHGIMRKEGAGKIKIRIWREPAYIRCSIEDDGIGYYANVPKDPPHTSRGLELIRQRMGQGGELIIRELKNQTGEAAGTLVELTIAQL